MHICFYLTLMNMANNEWKTNVSITSYNYFSRCLFASFLDLVFKRNEIMKNMKYIRCYIYREYFAIYKRFCHAFHQLTKGKFFKNFQFIREGLEFAKWFLMLGKSAGPILREAEGVYLCVDQDGWKHLLSTLPPSALLMTSVLASGINIP